MSNDVLRALKNIDQASTGTRWVIPGSTQQNQTPKISSINNGTPQEQRKEETNSTFTQESPKPPQEQKKVETTSNTNAVASTPSQEQKKEETTPKQPVNNTPKEPRVQKFHEPEPDFKKKLEELHSKPNRPGVIAQHEYLMKEPPMVHASYTNLPKKSNWKGPTPDTFDTKVDWLDETGEFHYYQYKASQPKKYNEYPDRPHSYHNDNNNSTNNDNTEGPSVRSTGVDMDHVPSKSKFSSLLSVYNNGGQTEEQPKEEIHENAE